MNKSKTIKQRFIEYILEKDIDPGELFDDTKHKEWILVDVLDSKYKNYIHGYYLTDKTVVYTIADGYKVLSPPKNKIVQTSLRSISNLFFVNALVFYLLLGLFGIAVCISIFGNILILTGNT